MITNEIVSQLAYYEGPNPAKSPWSWWWNDSDDGYEYEVDGDLNVTLVSRESDYDIGQMVMVFYIQDPTTGESGYFQIEGYSGSFGDADRWYESTIKEVFPLKTTITKYV